MIIELKVYTPSFQEHIKNYYVADLSYTASPQTVLANLKSSYAPILCFDKEQLVCFFVLDNGDDRLNYTKNQNSLLLRAFSTDSNHLKKGYATASLQLLSDFVRNYFPDTTHVYLGVNLKNKFAIRLYEKVGFVDTTRIFTGPKGPQKILKLAI